MREEQQTGALNGALERLAQGATVEECLAPYPQEAGELEPLLRMVQAMTAAVPEPRPQARAEVMGRLTEAWEERHARRGEGLLLRPTLPLLRPLAAALTAVMVLVLGGWGTISTAANSVPEDLLYPVKMARERLILAVSPSSQKAKVHARLAAERSKEMEALAVKAGSPAEIQRLSRRMMDHTQKAVRLVDGAMVASLATPPVAGTGAVASDAAPGAAALEVVALAPEASSAPSRARAVQEEVREEAGQEQVREEAGQEQVREEARQEQVRQVRTKSALNKVRAEVRQLLVRQQQLQDRRFQQLTPSQQERLRRAFQETQEHLRWAIHTLELLEAQEEDEAEYSNEGGQDEQRR